MDRGQELQRAYQFSDAQLLPGFSELLCGDTQLWYRNIAADITTWAYLEVCLKTFHLSPGELRHLDRQISDRKQSLNEPVRAHVTTLTTFMRHRGGYSTMCQLDMLL